MAAGQGFKTFTTGEVLTAGDVNGYLMQGINVFATTTARNAAITAPAEGQFAFTKDTNSLWYYDGAAWVASGATGDIEGVSVTSPITGGGTSGTVTIGIDSTAVVPSQTGNSGKYLTTNGTAASWATVSASSTFATDISVNSIIVGRSGGNIATNTTVGATALDSNTTGSLNTAIGSTTLTANTTGELNTGVGPEALLTNTTGSFNTAVGVASQRQGATASNNTSIGYAALFSVTGSQNTGLGDSAGGNLSSGTNNTMLGYNSQASSGTVSNTITLGDGAITTLRCQVTSITAISDERDKKNIEPLKVGLNFVKTLKPVTFDWNMRPRKDRDGNEITGGKIDVPDTGFIAQDFVAAEDAVGMADHLQLTYRDNPDALEITQGRLIPILVKAIQDLTAKVEALENAGNLI